MDKYKVTMSCGTEVTLRPMKIKDYQNSAAIAGKQAAGNPALTSLLMQNEILKSLLLEKDGKVLGNAEKEDLDALFSIDQYHQLMSVVEGLLGKGQAPKMEMISA